MIADLSRRDTTWLRLHELVRPRDARGDSSLSRMLLLDMVHEEIFNPLNALAVYQSLLRTADTSMKQF